MPLASSRVRSASSRLPRILSARASMPFFTAGKANLAMRKKSTRNEMAPQMISLPAGRMGFVFDSSAAGGASWATHSTAVRTFITTPLGELDENEDDEADQGEGLGEGDAEEHGGTHHAG